MPMLLAIVCFAAAIWLSNKTYETENEKRVGWLIAIILFFVAMPMFLYLGGA